MAIQEALMQKKNIKQNHIDTVQWMLLSSSYMYVRLKGVLDCKQGQASWRNLLQYTGAFALWGNFYLLRVP